MGEKQVEKGSSWSMRRRLGERWGRMSTAPRPRSPSLSPSSSQPRLRQEDVAKGQAGPWHFLLRSLWRLPITPATLLKTQDLARGAGVSCAGAAAPHRAAPLCLRCPCLCFPHLPLVTSQTGVSFSDWFNKRVFHSTTVYGAQPSSPTTATKSMV